MKRALVISGGGSKGAFAVGVLKELFQYFPLVDFDIYVGTSTGSLVTSLAAVKKIKELEYLYTHLQEKDILKKGNIISKLNDTSIFDVTPLWNQIQNNYSAEDYEELSTSGKRVFMTTVCLQTNELHVFTNDATSITPSGYKIEEIINLHHYRRAMLASCCQPIFTQPIKVGKGVPGAPNQQYQFVDGGVLEYAGIQIAIDVGATDIIAIMLSPENETKTDEPEFTNLMEILGKTVDILVSEVSKNDLKLVEQFAEGVRYITSVKENIRKAGVLSDEDIEKFFTLDDDNIFQHQTPVNLIKIRPLKHLGGGPGGLNFDPAEMTGMLAAGQLVFNDIASDINLDPFIQSYV